MRNSLVVNPPQNLVYQYQKYEDNKMIDKEKYKEIELKFMLKIW